MSYRFTDDQPERPPSIYQALAEIIIVIAAVSMIINVYTWANR